jgi:hypothetical protein
VRRAYSNENPRGPTSQAFACGFVITAFVAMTPIVVFWPKTPLSFPPERSVSDMSMNPFSSLAPILSFRFVIAYVPTRVHNDNGGYHNAVAKLY